MSCNYSDPRWGAGVIITRCSTKDRVCEFRAVHTIIYVYIYIYTRENSYILLLMSVISELFARIYFAIFA